jgi:hypothetical protein
METPNGSGDCMTSETTDRYEPLERSLIEVAVETRQFSQLFARVVNKLDA